MSAQPYKSPWHQMTQTTPTCLWNHSASVQELSYAIDHGAVGATCNAVIVLNVPNKEMDLWRDRIQQLIQEMPKAREDEIGCPSRPIPVTKAGIPAFRNHMHFSEFRRAYEPEGMTVEEFDAFGPTVRTIRQFAAGCHDLAGLIRDFMMPSPDL